MATEEPSPLRRIAPIAGRHAPWIFVVLLSAWLLWPVPAGEMPMSADHTVHLTRIWMWAQELSQGQVRGWSSVWFFGTPVGELYPVLGDAIIIAVRVLSLGALSWSGAYAIGFFLVFATQGLALLRAGRAAGLGPWPGLIAAALLLCDVGAYREGGWLYTVSYGVWPQALSTALTWLAFAELTVACTSDDESVVRRRIATSALAFGGSLLAHPMAMLSTAIGGPLLVLVLGIRGGHRLRHSAVSAVLAAGLGIAIAAWWLVPMLRHNGWMASYGWLWRPLASMGKHAGDGHFAQAMPTAVGACIAFGIGIVALTGSRPARFFALFGLALWAMASHESLWTLRLDLLSAGFAQVQYQRFIIAAKPGLYLAAGIGLSTLLHWGALLWRDRGRGRVRPAAAVFLWAIVGGATLWMAQGQRELMREYDVGKVQIERLPGAPDRDTDFAALTEWAAEKWQQRDRSYRMTFNASRDVHWFMDAPVYTNTPTYKQGFTPGDNFVHKPESGKARVLDRLGVRYVVTERARGGRGQLAAEFGDLRVLERAGWREQQIAWLEGPGTLTLDETDDDEGIVSGTISGSGGTTRLVFAVGGFPRWELTVDGQPVEWFEIPVVSPEPTATQAERRGGALRGGKAAGDDGSEPTLLAADVGDGSWRLRYRGRTGLDLVTWLLSALALALAIALLLGQRRLRRAPQALAFTQRKLRRIGHPIVLAAIAVAFFAWAVMRWSAGSAAESVRAVGWVRDGRAQIQGRASTQPFKTDMLIQPAVVVGRKARGPVTMTFPGIVLGATLDGWTAIDDDASKLRREGSHRVTIEVGDGEHWTALGAWNVAHRGGTVPLSLPTGEHEGATAHLRVTVTSEGESPPPFGFDLVLGGGSARD